MIRSGSRGTVLDGDLAPCGYNVVVITADGRNVHLLDDIRTPDEAVSIERAIERHLGIPDWSGLGEKRLRSLLPAGSWERSSALVRL